MSDWEPPGGIDDITSGEAEEPREGLSLLPPPPVSASGLDERQIAAQDIAELHSLLRVIELPIAEAAAELHTLEPGVGPPPVQEVVLSLSAPRTLKLRLVPLPQRATVKKVAIEASQAKLRHSLELIQRQPVRRQRLSAADLSRQQREALSRALFQQYGKGAQKLLPSALFAHIPPELKENLRLASDGSTLGILVPRGFNASKASSGTWLVLLEDQNSPQSETRRLLLRL